MKAAVFHKVGEALRIEDVKLPRLGPNDVLVKTAAAGLCHTDLGIMDGHVPIGSLPMILGHEIAGQIVQVGNNVTAELIDQRVCVNYGLVCGKCIPCRSGNDTLCEHWQTMGRTVNGGFAEYMAVPAENVMPIPDGLSYDEAAIIPCSVATAYHAVKRAGAGVAQKVAVFGVGGVGLNAVQFAALAGSDITAIDISDEKLEVARSLGARNLINAKKSDVVSTVKRLSNGAGADVCLEFVGSPATYQASVESVRRGGRVVVAGYHPEPVKINSLRLMLDEVVVTGAHVANRLEVKEIIDLVADGRVSLKRMITHIVPFSDINAGFDRLRSQQDNPIRIVVRL